VLVILREQVEEFLQFFQTHSAVETIERWYHEDVVMQENMQQPRVGRAISLERQRRAAAAVRETHDFKIGVVLVDGDRVVIEESAEWTMVDGYRVRIEELALQTWRDGKIIHERFFYDASDLAGITRELYGMH
jgi:ketosteroid isomerase-like protein